MHRCSFLICLFLAAGINAQSPSISTVINSVSLSPTISPGSLVTVFGSGFGPDLDNPSAIVSVNAGGREVPILFRSPNQINFQLPAEAPIGPATIEVKVGQKSIASSVSLSNYAPAVLTANNLGYGVGVFENKYGLITSVVRAAPGDVVTVYAAGLGATSPNVPAGTAAPESPAASCLILPGVRVGGVAAVVESASLAPGLTGVYQVSFVMPDVSPTDQPVVLSVDGIESSPVSISVGSTLHATVLRDMNGTTSVRIMARSQIGQASSTPPGVAAKTIQQLRVAGSGSVPPTNNFALLPSVGKGASLPPASGGVSGTVAYTCDPTIGQTLCTTLNTAIAGIYASAFTNANVSIYITFGSTGLGQNLTSLFGATYTSFRNALIATQTSANDATAISNSVPVTNPFGNDQVAMSNATARVLGFNPTFGIQPNGQSCALGSGNCYDSIVTISSSQQSSGNLFYRTGTILPGQYDFFTVVEHETDEALGTISFAFGFTSGGTTYIAPADLFRYHSNGARSLAAGGNTACSVSDAANACFSINGATMLQQYHNTNDGADAGDWQTNCAAPRVQDAFACAGSAGVDIAAAAEILVLDVVGFRTSSAGPPTPDLTITKSHTGSFTQGQNGATYTITVTNSGTGATNGSTVTVSDTLPSGLTATAISGSGWNCTQPSGPCTRSDALAAGLSYSPITLTVNVAGNAPASVTNTATVSGGGETNTANNTANDVTTITASGGGSATSIWASTVIPSVGWVFDAPGTFGLKFRSDVAGNITGVRFYKGAGNTGAHTGLLYSKTGTLLAVASFTSETASGWQQVTFPGVAIAANTTYIVALHSTTGYAVDNGYFTNTGVDNPPLHALKAGVDGPNGVVTYANFPLFPTSPSRQDSNYWVDVVFAAN